MEPVFLVTVLSRFTLHASRCLLVALALVAVLPWAVQAQTRQQIEMLRRNPDARSQVLSVTANAVEVVPDKQGRILIPERLQRAAQLEGEALIVGVLEKIEIWNPDLFEGTTREAKPGFEQFVRQILS